MSRNPKRSRRKPVTSGKNTRPAEILKYLMAFALLVYVALLLIYSSGSTKSFAEMSENIGAGLKTESLVKQNTQALKRYYGLNSADYDGADMYLSKDSISAEEILLVKVKTDQQIHIIKDAVRARVESRKNSFESLAPKQVKLLDQAQVLVRGRFVFFVVSEDAQRYVDLFTGSL